MSEYYEWVNLPLTLDFGIVKVSAHVEKVTVDASGKVLSVTIRSYDRMGSFDPSVVRLEVTKSSEGWKCRDVSATRSVMSKHFRADHLRQALDAYYNHRVVETILS
jgi:hypothetical protein